MRHMYLLVLCCLYKDIICTCCTSTVRVMQKRSNQCFIILQHSADPALLSSFSFLPWMKQISSHVRKKEDEGDYRELKKKVPQRTTYFYVPTHIFKRCKKTAKIMLIQKQIFTVLLLHLSPTAQHTPKQSNFKSYFKVLRYRSLLGPEYQHSIH